MLALLVSCRAARPPAASSHAGASAEDYLARYGQIAISEMNRTGVPASIKLAQGIIESNYGRSTLAREANNHFGIKCHNDWKGPVVRHHDDKRNECFRKYRTAEESFYDHSDFLRRGTRYSFLFEIDPTDYKAWARGLKKAGYATNPHYDNMLIRKIEELNLQQYDRGYAVASANAAGKASVPASSPVRSPEKTPARPDAAITGGSAVNETPDIPVSSSTFTVTARTTRIMENNRLQYIFVRDGDSFETLAREFQLLKREILRFNDLSEGHELIPGQMLYLQPKRDRAEQGNDYHVAVQGETMHSVSQKYGIRLRNLHEMNRMKEGEEPVAGQRLWLRSVKPAG